RRYLASELGVLQEAIRVGTGRDGDVRAGNGLSVEDDLVNVDDLFANGHLE
ncbi:Hypothetical predicted protein, partial [Pelobates cultripes]